MPWRSLLLLVAFVCVLPDRALAHGLYNHWTLKDGKLVVKAFFDDDSDAQDVRVRLYDATQKVVAEGKTDARGKCVLAAPAPGQYRLVVDDGAGHRSTDSVTISGVSTTPTEGAPTANRARIADHLWLRVGLGLGVIGGLGVAAWLGLRRKTAPAE